MKKETDIAKLIRIIEEKIEPLSINEIGKSNLATLLAKHSYERLLQCIDIGFSNYIKLDSDGKPTPESAELFFDKLGGIAYNLSLNPIDKEMKHILNLANKQYSYWNSIQGAEILEEYVLQLKKAGWNENRILGDLEKDTLRLVKKCRNWTDWKETMEGWTNDVKSWQNSTAPVEIIQMESVLPNELFTSTPQYVQKLCKQINASYEMGLYDCTSVMIRRLLEILLILAYQNYMIEEAILDNGSGYHISLDKMIKEASQNKTIGLSVNTKKGMEIYKELGNYSAHKIWYNCTKKDIEPYILKYRAIIEELLYKSGLR